jgi:transposase
MSRGGHRRRYPEDFKRSAIELALTGDKAVTEIAADLGLSVKTLHNWLRIHKDQNGMNAEGEDNSLEAEIKHLRKENALLKKEREILKKATAYFAKDTL